MADRLNRRMQNGSGFEDEFFNETRDKFDRDVKEFEKMSEFKTQQMRSRMDRKFSSIEEDEFFKSHKMDSMMDDFDKEFFEDDDSISRLKMSSRGTGRSAIQSESSRVISITAEGNAYKVMLDLDELGDGKINMQVKNREELTVEANSASGGFKQTFFFSGIRQDDIQTEMAPNGILTLVVPIDGKPDPSILCDNSHLFSKKLKRNTENDVTITKIQGFYSSTQFNEIREEYFKCIKRILEKFDISSEPGCEIELYKMLREDQFDDSTQLIFHQDLGTEFMILLDMDGYNPDKIYVTQPTKTQVVVEAEKSSSGTCIKFTRVFNIPENLKYSEVRCNLSSENLIIIYLVKETQSSQTKVLKIVKEDGFKFGNAQTSTNTTSSVTKSTKQTTETTLYAQKTLISANFTLTQKQSFFSDVVFVESITHFIKIIKRLFKFQNSLDNTATWEAYLKAKELQDKSIVNSTVQQTTGFLKIILDVSNLRVDSLTIEKNGFNEIIVEGIVNNRGDQTPQSPQRVSKTFVITEDIEDDQILDCYLSSDGILLIQVEKEDARLERLEREEEEKKETEKREVEKQKALVAEQKQKEIEAANQKKKASETAAKKAEKTQSASTKANKETAKGTKIAVHQEETKKTQKDVTAQLKQTFNARSESKTSQTQKLLFDSTKMRRKGKIEMDIYFQQEQLQLFKMIREFMQHRQLDEKSFEVSSYRKYFTKQSDLTSFEHRLGTVSEDSMYKKIILDIYGIDEQSLTIIQVDNGILVEGLYDENIVGSVDDKKFSKFFEIPYISPDADFTSAISADGFLLVKVSKDDDEDDMQLHRELKSQNSTPKVTFPDDDENNEVINCTVSLPKRQSSSVASADIPDLVSPDEDPTTPGRTPLSPIKIVDVDEEKKENQKKSSMKKVKSEESKTEVNEALTKKCIQSAQSGSTFEFYGTDNDISSPADQVIDVKDCGNLLEDSSFTEYKDEIYTTINESLEAHDIYVKNDYTWRAYEKGRLDGTLISNSIMNALDTEGKKFLISFDTVEYKRDSIKVTQKGAFYIDIQWRLKLSEKTLFKRCYLFPGVISSIKAFHSEEGVLLIVVETQFWDESLITDEAERFSSICLPYDELNPHLKKITQYDIDALNKKNAAAEAMSHAELNQISFRNYIVQSLSKIELDKLIHLCATTLPTLKTRSSIRHEILSDIYANLIARIDKDIENYIRFSKDSNVAVPKTNDEKLWLYRTLINQEKAGLKRICFGYSPNEEVFQILIDMEKYTGDQYHIAIEEKKTVILQCFKTVGEGQLVGSFRRFFCLPRDFDLSTMFSILTSDGFLFISFTQEKKNPYNKNLIRQISEANDDEEFFRYILDFNDIEEMEKGMKPGSKDDKSQNKDDEAKKLEEERKRKEELAKKEEMEKLQAQKKLDEEERKRLDELARQKEKGDLEAQKKLEEEKERKRREELEQQEAQKKLEEEKERKRKEEEEKERKKKEEEEKERKRKEELEKQEAQKKLEEEKERKRKEELAKKKELEKLEAKKKLEEEKERKRKEELAKKKQKEEKDKLEAQKKLDEQNRLKAKKESNIFPIEDVPKFLGEPKFKASNEGLSKSLKKLLKEQFGDKSLEKSESSVKNLGKGLMKYEDYRKGDFTSENQLLVISRDKDTFEIVLDITEVLDDTIEVKHDDNDVLTLEAKYQQIGGDKHLSYDYGRTFEEFGSINIDSVKVRKSNDGFLIISGIKPTKEVNIKLDSESDDDAKKKLQSQKSSDAASSRDKDEDKDKIIVDISTSDPLFDKRETSKLQLDMSSLIQDKLKKYNITAKEDYLSQYRLLRQKDYSYDTQVYSVSFSGNTFIIVLDVTGFQEDELKINISKGYLMVEGITDSKNKLTYKRDNFIRRFFLTEQIDTASFRSYLTTDEFLIIRANLNDTFKPSSKWTPDAKSAEFKIEDVTNSEEVQNKSFEVDKKTGKFLMDDIDIAGAPYQVLQPKVSTKNFVDTYGKNAYEDYINGMKSLLKSHKYSTTDSADTLKKYAILRKSDMSMNTQAWCFSKHNENEIVVVDVMEFLKGVIRITILGRYVLMEGYAEVLIDGVLTIFTFRRWLKLRDLKNKNVFAEISKDGLLAISFKEKEAITQPEVEEVSQPVTKELARPKRSSVSGFRATDLSIERIRTFFDSRHYDSPNRIFMGEMKNVLKNNFYDTRFDNVEYSRKSLLDSFNVYRTHRGTHFSVDSQIALLYQDKQYFKIIVDLLGAVEDSISVQLTSPTEISIRSLMELKSVKTTTRYSFYKSFKINGRIIMKTLTSEMSNDGLLFIMGESDYSAASTVDSVRSYVSDQTSHGIADFSEIASGSWIGSSFNKDIRLSLGKSESLYSGDVADAFQRNLLRLFLTTLNKFNIDATSETAFNQYLKLRKSIYTYDTQVLAVTRTGNKYQIALDIQGYHEDELTVTYTTKGFIVIEGKLNNRYNVGHTRCNFKRCYYLPYYVDFSTLRASICADGFLIITGDMTLNKGRNTTWLRDATDSNTRIIDVTEYFDTDKLSGLVEIEDSAPSTTSGSVLSPKEKDSLFADCFSKFVYDYFLLSVKRILRFNGVSCSGNYMEAYRKFRASNLEERCQAWSIFEEDDRSMLMLDVEDFIDGDINIELIDDRYVVIEGFVEKEVGDHFAGYSFKKFFKLSKPIQKYATITELTQDGILVVTLTEKMEIPIPKKVVEKCTKPCIAPPKYGLAKSSSLTKCGSCTEFCEVRRKGNKGGLSGYSKHFLCPSKRPKHAKK